MRTIVAGIFTYMELFELSPPHTHNRAANAVYVLAFAGGVSMAYTAELVEQVTAVEG